MPNFSTWFHRNFITERELKHLMCHGFRTQAMIASISICQSTPALSSVWLAINHFLHSDLSKWYIFHLLNAASSDEDSTIHYINIYNNFNIMRNFFLDIRLHLIIMLLSFIRDKIDSPNWCRYNAPPFETLRSAEYQYENEEPHLYCFIQHHYMRNWGSHIPWDKQQARNSTP